VAHGARNCTPGDVIGFSFVLHRFHWYSDVLSSLDFMAVDLIALLHKVVNK